VLTLLFLPALYAAWLRVKTEKTLDNEAPGSEGSLSRMAA